MKPLASHAISALFVALTVTAPFAAAAQFNNTFPPPGFGPNSSNAVGRIMPGSNMPCTVSFTMWKGVILLTVIMGDGLPVAAAFDTGLPLSLVSPKLAASKSMKPTGTREITVLDHKITVANAPAQVIRLDRMSLSGIPFGICDLVSQLSANPTPDAPAIWLGSNVLEGLIVTIDPPKGQLVFRQANASIPGKVVRVPFALRDGRMWVDVTANSKEKFEAVIDTSSAATLLPAKVATALQLKPDKSYDIVDKNGKPGKVGMAKVGQFTLGKQSVKDVPVMFVTEGDPQGIEKDFAVIGNDFLFRHRFSIDLGRKEIAFESLEPESAPKDPKKDPKKGPKKDSKKDPKKDVKKDDKKDDKKVAKPKDDTTKQGDNPDPGDQPPPVDPPPAAAPDTNRV